MSRTGNRSWFAGLRRDRNLFALVAVFALMLAVIQPAVPAVAAPGAQGGFVICSAHGGNGASGGQQAPDDHRDCPCCFFGHACGGMPLLSKLIQAHQPAFAPVASIKVAVAWPDPGPRGHSGPAASPPGIRAPPHFL